MKLLLFTCGTVATVVLMISLRSLFTDGFNIRDVKPPYKFSQFYGSTTPPTLPGKIENVSTWKCRHFNKIVYIQSESVFINDISCSPCFARHNLNG